MLNLRLFRLIRDQRLSVPILRCFHDEFSHPGTKKLEKDDITKAAAENNLPGAISKKYKVFHEDESPEIFDVFEERQRYQTQDVTDEIIDDDYKDLNLKRGLNGVFDIEDLVDVLRKENAEDIFVCSVPKDIKYIDYMVICSGRSYRHMLGMAEFVRRIYKIKRQKRDLIPKIEGENSRDWMAMDLGNIALHIFSPTTRETYDLESLWAVGVEYDRECNKPQDPLIEFFEKHSILFDNVKPLKS